MEFYDFYRDAVANVPRMSRKKTKGLIAKVNTAQRAMRFLNRPDLAARYLKVLEAQMERAAIRYSPSDPRRLP